MAPVAICNSTKRPAPRDTDEQQSPWPGVALAPRRISAAVPTFARAQNSPRLIGARLRRPSGDIHPRSCHPRLEGIFRLWLALLLRDSLFARSVPLTARLVHFAAPGLAASFTFA